MSPRSSSLDRIRAGVLVTATLGVTMGMAMPSAEAATRWSAYSLEVPRGGHVCAMVIYRHGTPERVSVWDSRNRRGFPSVSGSLSREQSWKKPFRWVAREDPSQGFAVTKRGLHWAPYYGEEGRVWIPKADRT